MQSDCENTGVFKDFHFVTCVAFVYNPVTRRLQKRLQNHSLEGPKTVPKCSSMTYASWKRFWDGFGTSLDSHMAPQKRSLRRPRGIKKRLLFSLASQDVSRMDSGRHLDPLGLDFESFWEALLAWKFNPNCVWHFCFALHFVELQMHWTSKYWSPFETSFLQSWASLPRG